MTTIKMTVTGQAACAEASGPLTMGTIGLPVRFDFDDAWDGLTKTAVFRAGVMCVDRVAVEEETTVPWEVMQKKNCTLQIGVYGANQDGTVVMPTVWAKVGVIQPGAAPAGDASADPSLPVWQQVLEKATVAETVAKSAAAAAEEVQAAYEAGELNGKDGHTPVKGVDYFTEEDMNQIAQQLHTAVIITQETSYSDVLAAWNAGHKHIMLDVTDPNNSIRHFCAPLYSYEDGNGFTFRVQNPTLDRRWDFLKSGKWNFTQTQIPSIKQYNDLLARVKVLENN